MCEPRNVNKLYVHKLERKERLMLGFLENETSAGPNILHHVRWRLKLI